jgi:hypothetical protein
VDGLDSVRIQMEPSPHIAVILGTNAR